MNTLKTIAAILLFVVSTSFVNDYNKRTFWLCEYNSIKNYGTCFGARVVEAKHKWQAKQIFLKWFYSRYRLYTFTDCDNCPNNKALVITEITEEIILKQNGGISKAKQ